MERWLGRYSEILFAVLRVVAGLMFAMHGSQKLLAWPVGPKAGVPLMQVGGAIELVGGLLIALGLFASYAAFVASGEMAVAYFMVHFQGGFWPLVNKGELAVLYCFLFLYIAARGAGPYSVDHSMRKR
jgi:putative oxidoreductase